MNCIGIETSGGTAVQVTFDSDISAVAPVSHSSELYLSPGFIDLQVNGFLGVDFNNPKCTPEQIAHSIRGLFATGVTRFYPTVITGSPDSMVGALRNLKCAQETLREGAAIDGFHVEGPHISPDDGPRGAHPLRWVRPPDLDEFHRWQEATGNQVRIVTLSPDWPQSLRYIEAITAEGVVASIGHTGATAQQLADAVSAGATLSTHLGNGAHPVMRRHPNYLWEQLAEDRLMADFIVDGIHLGPSFLRVALRAKTVARSVLVTDAAAPAGCPPGRYQLGEQAVELTTDNRVMLVGQERLAGSALRMDRGVENLMRLGGLSLTDAVSMATTNAATAGRVPGRMAGLVPGDRADLIEYNFNKSDLTIAIKSTYVSGEKVYEA
ncbi:MAG TPA: amidohydrolase family protein [Bryobacteraceae bacterium]|jgi:N-acetylglucosamine-6-phosphate deacetylase|nr:amidohydrolase family protein [Bryobacteraceae bacterium]